MAPLRRPVRGIATLLIAIWRLFVLRAICAWRGHRWRGLGRGVGRGHHRCRRCWRVEVVQRRAAQSPPESTP